jgi:hypothetical protein
VGFGHRAVFATRVMQGLFVLTSASLAFSATTVSALGVADLRVIVFCGLFAALALGAVLRCPRFAAQGRLAPLVALWLLAVLALLSVTFVPGAPTSLLDYKIGLPILALLVAPNLRAALGRLDLARFALFAGGFYVGATAALALALPSLATLRNVAGHVRVDITGSVVLHAALCTIVALTLAAALRNARSLWTRLGIALALAAAGWMVMLAGTRSPLLTVGLFVVLWVLAGRLGDLARPRLLGTGLIALLAFLALSFWASDTIWARLADLGHADYSSGRWPSIRHWLTLAAGQPFGLGMGAVRATLDGGRPIIAAGHLLEWPHNEFVRFFVEGGVLGLMLLLLVVGEALRRARRRALVTDDPVERVLLLAIAADMLAQCLLQNYFNSVYHATVMLLLLGLLAADYEEVESPREGGASPRPHRYSVR